MSKVSHTSDRLQKLEESVAEIADILTHFAWGCHGSDNIHNRSFELAKRTAEQVGRVVKEVKEVKRQAGASSGRKFR